MSLVRGYTLWALTGVGQSNNFQKELSSAKLLLNKGSL